MTAWETHGIFVDLAAWAVGALGDWGHVVVMALPIPLMFVGGFAVGRLLVLVMKTYWPEWLDES